MLSSPYGRTLHTAKIIADTISGINASRKSTSRLPGHERVGIENDLAETRFEYSTLIERSEELTKSKGFNIDYILPLIHGGVLNFGGDNIQVDPNETNPEGYDYNTYMVKDRIKRVAENMKSVFPSNYIQYLMSVETFESVTSRMLKVLEGIATKNRTPEAVIVVTHGSLLGFLSYVYSKQFTEEIKPGGIIALEIKNGKTTITKASKLLKVAKHDILVDEFNTYFDKH